MYIIFSGMSCISRVSRRRWKRFDLGRTATPPGKSPPPCQVGCDHACEKSDARLTGDQRLASHDAPTGIGLPGSSEQKPRPRRIANWSQGVALSPVGGMPLQRAPRHPLRRKSGSRRPVQRLVSFAFSASSVTWCSPGSGGAASITPRGCPSNGEIPTLSVGVSLPQSLACRSPPLRPLVRAHLPASVLGLDVCPLPLSPSLFLLGREAQFRASWHYALQARRRTEPAMVDRLAAVECFADTERLSAAGA